MSTGHEIENAISKQHNLENKSYILSNENVLDIRSPETLSDFSRWQPLIHYNKTRPSLILLPGETLCIKACEITEATVLFLSYGRGLPKISVDGLSIDVYFSASETKHLIFSTLLYNGDHNILQEMTTSLQAFTGQTGNIEISVGPGPQHDPIADWLGISELVVGDAESINLLRSRAFFELRAANEMSHFESVYDHKVFDTRQKAVQGTVKLKSKKIYAPSLRESVDITKIEPMPGEDPFLYGHRLLSEALYTKAPNFYQCLADIAHKGSIDIISFCAGTAQVEAALIASTDAQVNLTLVDINSHLLEQAHNSMPDNCTLDVSIQDINKVSLPDASYDVAIFVSGVHHVVELEHVWRQIHKTLRDKGELWLIGEQIGPNGNMLDTAALAKANAVFMHLDEKYRLNGETGNIDTLVQNRDCSEATFEGIRSQDIENTLRRQFVPKHIYRRNCFLWRLLNQTYYDNYDLSVDADIEAIKYIAQEEVKYFTAGGRATEIHGVYRPIR